MGIVVVGSIAIDTISTPLVRRRRVLGGSAVYASIAISSFSPVRLVGVVGSDFPDDAWELLESRGISLEGVSRQSGRTFAWEGEYSKELGDPQTLDIALNVFAQFQPSVPDSYRNESAIFLGNIDPELQIHVLSQMTGPAIAAADTMSHWLDLKPAQVKSMLKMVNFFFVNEREAKILSGEAKVLRAARAISSMGPRVVVVKTGEHGAMAFDGRTEFSCWAPAYPTYEVHDPTGAGDSFAGGFMGSLVQAADPFSPSAIKKALAIGNVLSSYAISEVGIEGLLRLNEDEMVRRLSLLYSLVPSQEDGRDTAPSRNGLLVKALSS